MTTVELNTTTKTLEVFATARVPTTYPGQTTIVTVGTVTTGTWQATDIGVAYGGTGASTAADARANLDVPGLSAANTFTATQTFSGGSGAHGLGAVNLPLPPNNDLNDVTETGFVHADASTLNAPASWVTVHTQRRTSTDDGRLAQTARLTIGSGEPRVWERMLGDGASWSAWREVWHEGNYAGPVLADLTVNIPTDYATLQAALDDLSTRTVQQGVRIILNIESGHALTAGLRCEHGDFGHFRIESVDATVPLDAGFTGIAPTNSEDSSLTDILIFGFNARMPELACVIDMGNAHDNGYHTTHSSMGNVAPNCGVINAGGKGLFVRASVVYAQSSTWDGANAEGISVQQGGVVAAQLATCDNCAQTSGTRAVFASRGATLHFQEGSAQNSGADGGFVQRSWANLQQVNFNGAANRGLVIARGAHVIGRSMHASNCGAEGVLVQHGSYAALDRATLTNNTGLDVELSEGGGIVNLTDATTTNGSANVPSATDTRLELFNAVQDQGLIIAGGLAIGGRFTDPVSIGSSFTVTSSAAQSFIQRNNATPLVVERTDSTVNANIEYKSTAGSVWAGMGSAGIWAVGDGPNITNGGNAWLTVSSTAMSFLNNTVLHEGNAAITSIGSTPDYVGQLAVVSGEAYIAVGTAGTGDWKQITNA